MTSHKKMKAAQKGFGKTLSFAVAGAALFGANLAMAQEAAFSDGVIRIGVINDRSGIYADMSGEGSAIAARIAAESFGNAINGVPIEIVVADHQNKPDLGASIATKWFDADGVDVVVDVNNSAVSLALNALMPSRKKMVLHNSVTSDISGKDCVPRALQWQQTSYPAANNLVTKEMIDSGLDSFFIIAVDMTMGETAASAFTSAVEKIGGKVVGVARHPLNSADMSSYVLQAQASGAKAIMLGNAGNDLGNVVRQLREYGIDLPVFAAIMTADVVSSFGHDVMQGVYAMVPTLMTRDEESLKLKDEVEARWGKPFGPLPASTYSATLNYLKAVQAVGTDDADKVEAQIRSQTINDATFQNGTIRPDGLHSHDMYLVTVKAQDEVKMPGDYYNLIRTIPGDVANEPIENSTCPLVKSKS